MKKFFCFSKKDFCENTDLCIECPHFADTGGEYRESPMTNDDRINAMTIEEKAEFLSGIAYGRETPWSLPFLKEFCNNCPTVHCTYESGAEDDLHECDFVDGKCPHGSDIVWWLQQPAEDSTNG